MLDNQIINLKDSKMSSKLRDVLEKISLVAKDLSYTISLSPIDGGLDGEVGTNSDGDGQKALDIIADDAYSQALISTDVRWYASEEQEEVVSLNTHGSLAIAIDPLDGSSNINSNVSIGTIFGIYPAEDDGNDSFLRRGSELLAAGYVIFGPQTSLVFSVGQGIEYFVLDQKNEQFFRVKKDISITKVSTEYAINSSNIRHWSPKISKFVENCNLGKNGPFNKDYNMRWIASLVAETHRILIRGGIFLYTEDARDGYENGRLRMVYECAPIAYLIEQAGGLAVDGASNTLNLVPKSLHARTPFCFGSHDEILCLMKEIKIDK